MHDNGGRWVALAGLAALVATVVVGTGSPVGAQAGPGGISGTVTAAGGGPLAGVCVTALPPFTFEEPEEEVEPVEDTTDGDGVYSLDVPPGDYLLAFNDCEQPLPGYAREYWHNARGLDDADSLPVDDVGRTGIDADLDPGSTISGTVTDADTTDPEAGICVQAFDEDTGASASAVTDADGEYVLSELAAGGYVLVFIDCSDPLTYIGELYDDVPLTSEGDDPDLVVLDAGETAPGIDAELELGGLLSGTVTAAHNGDGAPLLCVSAWPVGGDPFDGPAAVTVTGAPATPDGDVPPPGDWMIGGLPAGDYEVEINSDECEDDSWDTEWYDDVREQDDAEAVTLAQGQVITNLDSELRPAAGFSVVCFNDEGESGFPDVPPGNVHATAVGCLADHGIASGSGGLYRPANNVRRDQMASFVARTLVVVGFDLPATPPAAFIDNAGSPHERSINQLAALGIVSGVGGGRYDPTGIVRREQLATFLVRAYEEATGLTLLAGGDRFTDDTASVHEVNINKVANAAMTSGTSPTTYSPNQLVRRDQMATFLARLLVRTAYDVIPPGFFDLAFGSAGAARSAAAGVLHAGAAGGDPRHHAAELLPDLLDLVGVTPVP